MPSTTTAGGPTSQTSTTTTTTRLLTQLSCADFGTWPDIDEVTCGLATAFGFFGIGNAHTRLNHLLTTLGNRV